MLDEIIELIDAGPIALARVIWTSGSGPRSAGATMVVSADGRPIGSLSAGCVEAVVINTGLAVINSGRSATERFGYADADGIEIGLTCGGAAEVFIERVDRSRQDQIAAMIAARDAGQPIALVTTLEAQPRWRLQTLDSIAHCDPLESKARALLRAGVHGQIVVEGCETPDHRGRARAFVQSLTSPPRMILAGANDFVRSLGAAAALVGYRVTVVDARPVFATKARFPEVDEVVIDWPHRYLENERAHGRLDDRTVVCVMSHDTKFDVPMLAAALRMGTLGFVGALGSRRTHAERVARLEEAGVTHEQMQLLNSPLGLDIGADSPAETAISILAQVIAQRSQASGQPLRDTHGPIHHALRKPSLVNSEKTFR